MSRPVVKFIYSFLLLCFTYVLLVYVFHSSFYGPGATVVARVWPDLDMNVCVCVCVYQVWTYMCVCVCD
jgi:hypothetical protein